MIEHGIFQAQSADWERVRSIRLRSLAESPDAFSRTLAEEQRLTDVAWRTRVDNEGVSHFLAVTSAGNDIGLAVGAPYTGLQHTAGLFAMWVAPEARKQGVGVSLVQAVVEWARNERRRKVMLQVATASTAAIRLYESCGFVRTGKTGTLPPSLGCTVELEMARVIG
jgi:GNAT superfamily N-acetyltransferase